MKKIIYFIVIFISIFTLCSCDIKDYSDLDEFNKILMKEYNQYIYGKMTLDENNIMNSEEYIFYYRSPNTYGYMYSIAKDYDQYSEEEQNDKYEMGFYSIIDGEENTTQGRDLGITKEFFNYKNFKLKTYYLEDYEISTSGGLKILKGTLKNIKYYLGIDGIDGTVECKYNDNGFDMEIKFFYEDTLYYYILEGEIKEYIE